MINDHDPGNYYFQRKWKCSLILNMIVIYFFLIFLELRGAMQIVNLLTELLIVPVNVVSAAKVNLFIIF